LHLRARPACIYVEESALKVTATQQAAGTHSFSSMYGLRSYQAFGLIIARRVSANSRLASDDSQCCLWLAIALPLLHIPNLAFRKITKKDMTDSGMRVADAHVILAETDHFKVAYSEQS